ncbi:NAD(+) diphosphatase [Pygmaiobacter massiliensis]|uniref:NAD(+) diphosphatase n=1 Tax=Pygmaiobacter massiliensis TaxID=1917873 RepID=UPI002A83711D|nr:NAD(+) diphosphatase [Pygmaiobacter massiliensis]MDY4784977.1 NAD(+) diphosphatase [Pygmaiobacter massiliensis]
MIQDIAPHFYNNSYQRRQATCGDTVFVFASEKMLCKTAEPLCWPTFEELDLAPEKAQYLFSIDNTAFFITSETPAEIPEAFSYLPSSLLRTAHPRHLAFAGFVAGQLHDWYRSNRFCGSCAAPMQHSEKERMLQCPVCGNMVYPKICPGVIVALTSHGRLLMSKYAGRAYTNYALLAGFTEVGETIEQTVAREVMEEVGLKVKNLRFYKSQPWAFSSSLLCGFFAEVDGNDTIQLDTEELAEAAWFTPEQINLAPDEMSLTREMMLCFKNGEMP